MPEKPYDLVVFGATSFVGKLLTRYLNDYQADSGEHFNWALAGRNMQKLEAVRASLNEAGRKLPLLKVDVTDTASLDEMCRHTRVVVSTVGPYALYGEPLVRACAESGTDYCDLTGEVHWVKRMMVRYQDTAQQTGARLVPCCGFDSVPSDMSSFYLQQQSIKQYGAPARHIQMRLHVPMDGLSGGSYASIINLVKEAMTDADVRKSLLNPFILCPPDHGFTAKQPRAMGPMKDKLISGWTAPFIMAVTNEAVVRRSHALSERFFDPAFTYDEAMMTGSGLKGATKACGIALTLGGAMTGLAFPPSRYVIEKYFLPSPGEGPSEAKQAAGHYECRMFGRTSEGGFTQVTLQGDGDPGYSVTSRMLAQAVLSLALDQVDDGGDKTSEGGFWTTASLLGQPYLDRLQAYAQLTFQCDY